MRPEDRSFYRGRTVLVTGHTGFKGAWLALWLQQLGARVVGYALAPPTHRPSLYDAACVGDGMESILGDVRDAAAVDEAFERHQPEIVFHLAAQPILLASYDDPVGTISTNVLGTVNVLDAVRRTPGVRVAVMVTSDKCYENREWVWGYREPEAMGGNDPYSASKGSAELVAAAYRRSFFRADDSALIATVRAGNVIGGGDWADYRVVPDMVRAMGKGEPVVLRYPGAVRPWLFVLDALCGYLMVGARLGGGDRTLATAWNFGPADADAVSVGDLATRAVGLWPGLAVQEVPAEDAAVKEDRSLRLDSSRARRLLGWRSALDLDAALQFTVEWYRAFLEGGPAMRDLSLRQIDAYEHAAAAAPAGEPVDHLQLP